MDKAAAVKTLVDGYFGKGGVGFIAVGKVTIMVSEQMSEPYVEVNWPSIGGKEALEALAFANDLNEACHIALVAEKAVRDLWLAQRTK